MLVLGLLLLPAFRVEAESLEISSSTFGSSTVSSTIADVNDWFRENLGMDLYQIINKIIAFMIAVVKIAINVLLEILPKVRDFLSAY